MKSKNLNSKFEDFVAQIEKENKSFKRLSKANKRVRIAEDVLERIRLNNIKAKNDCYFIIEGKEDISKNQSLQPLVNSSVTCTACAKGALFMSYIGRVNEFSAGSIKHFSFGEAEHAPMIKLQEIFAQKQLDMMETAFEGKSIEKDLVTEQEIQDCFNFHERSTPYYFVEDEVDKRVEEDSDLSRWDTRVEVEAENAEHLLVKICENLIRNKGTFDPNDIQ